MDDLSNWYVRRNRRRFWKGELDDDKRAAYATLHEVLADLTRLLAPFVPHLADAMWENLVAAVDAGRAGLGSPGRLSRADATASAHEPLEAAVALARQVVALGRTARAPRRGSKTRQPLATARVKLPGGVGSGAEPRIRRGGER